jgi:hypothetical protein
VTSLKTAGDRFEITFSLVAGGSGKLRGILTETDQNSQPSYVFVQPRHVLRVPANSPAKAGMIVRSPSGELFILGDNGPSEVSRGHLWNSFRLFEPTGKFSWKRRTKIHDPVTLQNVEGPEVDLGEIWVAMEPLDRALSDREMRVSFEQLRFITGEDIRVGDRIDNRNITKVDRQLGLAIGVVT